MKTFFFELDIDTRFSIVPSTLVSDAPTYLVRPDSLSLAFSRVGESERLGILA